MASAWEGQDDKMIHDTNRHRDSMTETAQWDNSVKSQKKKNTRAGKSASGQAWPGKLEDQYIGEHKSSCVLNIISKFPFAVLKNYQTQGMNLIISF